MNSLKEKENSPERATDKIRVYFNDDFVTKNIVAKAKVDYTNQIAVSEEVVKNFGREVSKELARERVSSQLLTYLYGSIYRQWRKHFFALHECGCQEFTRFLSEFFFQYSAPKDDEE